MLNGIDFSEMNGIVKWENIASGDISFAYFKATEAIDMIDHSFEMNITEARKSTIKFGVYHILHTGMHAGQQVDGLIEAVGDFKGMLPPVVSIKGERATGIDADKVAKTFVEILSKKIGVKPIIFTNKEFWGEHMANADWACDFPLWLDQPGSNWPQQVWPWAGWTFWQNSYQSRIPGSANLLGFNWFNGSHEELEAMIIQ